MFTTAWDYSSFHSLTLAALKWSVTTLCPCPVEVALGGVQFMLLLLMMEILYLKRMISLVVLSLEVHGHWAQFGSVGDSGSIVIGVGGVKEGDCHC